MPLDMLLLGLEPPCPPGVLLGLQDSIRPDSTFATAAPPQLTLPPWVPLAHDSPPQGLLSPHTGRNCPRVDPPPLPGHAPPRAGPPLSLPPPLHPVATRPPGARWMVCGRMVSEHTQVGLRLPQVVRGLVARTWEGGRVCWLVGLEGFDAMGTHFAPQVPQPPEANRLPPGLAVPQLLPRGASPPLAAALTQGPAEQQQRAGFPERPARGQPLPEPQAQEGHTQPPPCAPPLLQVSVNLGEFYTPRGLEPQGVPPFPNRATGGLLSASPPRNPGSI
ncbi:uncharacterized protein PS065_013606 [Dugong dugon]